MKPCPICREKKVRLSKIKIPEEMQLTPPSPQKLETRYTYFLRYREFQSKITVTRDFILTDGYTTYLLARMFGRRNITVHILPDKKGGTFR